MKHRRLVALGITLAAVAGPLAAQEHRRWLSLGPGSLSPNDPFTATLSFRAAFGWIANDRNAVGLDYTRQSANRSEGSDLGKYSRNYFGLSWQHAFRDAFTDEETLQQQYLLRLGVGVVERGTSRDVQPPQDLSDAAYLDAGASIRYPFSRRLAVVGTIDDVMAFLPHQVVTAGSTTYEFGGGMQHNFGLFIVLQWRV